MAKLILGAVLVPLALLFTLNAVVESYTETPDYLEELCRVHGERMLAEKGWELDGDEEIPLELAKREFPNCGYREFAQMQGRDWVSMCFACRRSLIGFYRERTKQRLLAAKARDE